MEDCLIKTTLDIKTGEILVKDPGFKVVFEDGSYKITVDVPSSNDAEITVQSDGERARLCDSDMRCKKRRRYR